MATTFWAVPSSSTCLPKVSVTIIFEEREVVVWAGREKQPLERNTIPNSSAIDRKINPFFIIRAS